MLSDGRLTDGHVVIAADGLYKRDLLRGYPLPLGPDAQTDAFGVGLPDPFAVATVGGEQTKTTSVIKKTLSPYWNESFDMYIHKPGAVCRSDLLIRSSRRVTEDSILIVQIFDQKKFKKRDQGFLGVINVRVGSVIDLDVGGDGQSDIPCGGCDSPVSIGHWLSHLQR